MELIETQHNIINKCLEKLKKLIIQRDRCDIKLNNILEDLILFYDSHFYTEKLYLKRLEKNGYITKDKCEKHIKDHDKFLDYLKFNFDSDSNMVVDVYLKLEKWNEDHIKDYDESDLNMQNVDGEEVED